jgi:hypothetical protein
MESKSKCLSRLSTRSPRALVSEATSAVHSATASLLSTASYFWSRASILDSCSSMFTCNMYFVVNNTNPSNTSIAHGRIQRMHLHHLQWLGMICCKSNPKLTALRFDT